MPILEVVAKMGPIGLPTSRFCIAFLVKGLEFGVFDNETGYSWATEEEAVCLAQIEGGVTMLCRSRGKSPLTPHAGDVQTRSQDEQEASTTGQGAPHGCFLFCPICPVFKIFEFPSHGSHIR